MRGAGSSTSHGFEGGDKPRSARETSPPGPLSMTGEGEIELRAAGRGAVAPLQSWRGVGVRSVTARDGAPFSPYPGGSCTSPVIGTKRTGSTFFFSKPSLVLVISSRFWKKLPTGTTIL